MVTFSLAYYEEYTFPSWADALGWMIGLFTLIPMPVFAIYSWKTGSVVSTTLYIYIFHFKTKLLFLF